MSHLVIGGAGFIGVNLATRLAEQGEEVAVLDDLSRRGADQNAAWLETHHPEVRFVRGDIRTDLSTLQGLVDKAETVYHLAAQVAVTTSVADPRTDFEINALGTLNVLEAVRTAAARPAGRPLQLDQQGLRQPRARPRRRARRPLRLRGRCPPASPRTSRSTSTAPTAAPRAARTNTSATTPRSIGLKTVVFRQSCIYGTRQFGVEDQGWIAWFCIAATGQPFTIYGDGKQIRDVLRVEDLIELFGTTVDQIEVARGRIYNVGGGPEYSLSLLEALDLLSAHLDAPIEPAFAPARPGDQRIYVSDLSKVERELGWKPKTAPPAGIEELVSWVTSHRDLFVTAY